jgi:hypothetical protein
MKRSLMAALFLVSMSAIAMGSQATSPRSQPPAASAPQFGGCRWYCGSKSYLTRSQCQANCSFECDQIC